MTSRTQVGHFGFSVGGLAAAYLRLSPPIAGFLLVVAVARLGLMTVDASNSPGALGLDWHCNADAARRWMAGQGYFLPRQLIGPYEIQHATAADLGEVLYPPIALYLFVPFSLLPDLAWWLVPAILTAVAVAKLKPARWSWPAIMLCLAVSTPTLVAGNPGMWLVPTAMWGAILGWPGLLAILKPSALPLALIGVTRRSWWLMLAVLALLALPFLDLWMQWIRVIQNTRDASAVYSLVQVPLYLIGIVSIVGSARISSMRALVTRSFRLLQARLARPALND